MCGCHCTCHPCSLPAKIASAGRAVGKKLLFIVNGARFSETSQTGNYVGMYVYTDALVLH